MFLRFTATSYFQSVAASLDFSLLRQGFCADASWLLCAECWWFSCVSGTQLKFSRVTKRWKTVVGCCLKLTNLISVLCQSVSASQNPLPLAIDESSSLLSSFYYVFVVCNLTTTYSDCVRNSRESSALKWSENKCTSRRECYAER